MKLTIIDYGAGNVRAVQFALERLGYEAVCTKDASIIEEADKVIFGSVSRFRERVGTQGGAREPASVSFELNLLDMRSGEVVWQSRFDETQQPLSSNLLKLWMYWRGGPRWFTARELARLGVDRLLDDMADTLIR